MNSARRRVIKELLSEKAFISLKELEELFPDVSSMTLRRDIEFFENQGDAIKVRGGARSMKFITTSMEEYFHNRMGENTSAKKRIAKRAVEFVKTGRSLFLDSGTTVLTLASMLPDERLTVVTTGPNIALELIKKKQPIINLVGGMVNRNNISISGSQAMNYLDNINIDLAFVVPSGLSLDEGFTVGNYPECELKQMIVRKARHVIMLVDTSKIDRSLPFTFAAIGDVQTIIADRPLPEELHKAAVDAGVEVIIAE